MLDQTTLHKLCQLAITAAIKAGQYIQSQFDQTYERKSKVGGDSLASQVVTEVDLRAQGIILHHLLSSQQTYDLGLLTEEAVDDDSRQVKDYFWCVDPMDGTLPFTEHRSGYAVSIALVSQKGDPVIAVVYVPDAKLCYSSVIGDGVQLNSKYFKPKQTSEDDAFHVYMDQSFRSEPYFEFFIGQMEEYAKQQGLGLACHADFGGVRNALGVISSARGCYVKYPKEADGCGSIWDYAATRLIGEELDFCVFNASGKRLYLNDVATTFMNRQGILYANDKALADYLVELGKKIRGGIV